MQFNQIRTFGPLYAWERGDDGRLLFHHHELAFTNEPKNSSPVRFRHRGLHIVLLQQVCPPLLVRPCINRLMEPISPLVRSISVVFRCALQGFHEKDSPPPTSGVLNVPWVLKNAYLL